MDRISAEVDNNKQAVHIQFAPVKTFEASGIIEHAPTSPCVWIKDEQGLSFGDLKDNANNTINIPNNFEFYTKFKINNSMFDNNKIQPVFTITDDNNNKYVLTFDTRPYIYNDNQKGYQINDNYLSFILSSNNSDIRIAMESYGDNLDFVVPQQFSYMVQSNSTPIGSNIYMVQENNEVNIINNNEWVQPSEQLIDSDGNYLIKSKIDNNGSQYVQYIVDYDWIDINNENRQKMMPFLYCRIINKDNSIEFDISQENFND